MSTRQTERSSPGVGELVDEQADLHVLNDALEAAHALQRAAPLLGSDDDEHAARDERADAQPVPGIGGEIDLEEDGNRDRRERRREERGSQAHH